jgi:hypothetical protein
MRRRISTLAAAALFVVAISGNPHFILLSPASSLLYANQTRF